MQAKLQAACFALLRKEASADKLFHTAWSSSPAVVFQQTSGVSPSVGSRVAIGTSYWGAGAGASSVLDLQVAPTVPVGYIIIAMMVVAVLVSLVFYRSNLSNHVNSARTCTATVTHGHKSYASMCGKTTSFWSTNGVKRCSNGLTRCCRHSSQPCVQHDLPGYHEPSLVRETPQPRRATWLSRLNVNTQAVVHQVRLFVQHFNEQQGKCTGLQQLCWTIGFIGVFGKFCIIPGCLLSWRAVGTLAFLLAIVSRVKDKRVFAMLLFFLGVTTLTSLNVPEVATPTGGGGSASLKRGEENRSSPVFNADFPVAEKYVSVPDNVIEQFENSKLQ